MLSLVVTIRYKHPVQEEKDRRSLLSFLKAKMHFIMSENALAHKGELGRFFTQLNPNFTRQCERASGILHYKTLIFGGSKYEMFLSVDLLSDSYFSGF